MTKILLLNLQNYNLVHIKQFFLLIFSFSFSLFSCSFLFYSFSKWHSTSEMMLVAAATVGIAEETTISCSNMVRQDSNGDPTRSGTQRPDLAAGSTGSGAS
ncbi:Uncharacterized protein TCM_002323 [Theobroma cacao]|uniref:Uncharacterized protein n=1 Tax=Theobroma cacao TaxID=3641 RepID=A0A061DLY5_THECC|nr:Uncharacterized protein TCM_002323 [Theobroma cacao]